MRTGRLSIGRGQSEEAPSGPRLRLVASGGPEPAPAIRRAEPAPLEVEAPRPPLTPEYHLVHDRLGSLERLAGLLDKGALSPEEYQAEKALILALPAEELVLRHPCAVAPAAEKGQGPSLAGRLLRWRVLPVGLVAGLALSFLAQPTETMRLADQALRWFA